MLDKFFDSVEEWHTRMICTGRGYVVHCIELAFLFLLLFVIVMFIPSCKPKQLVSTSNQQTTLISERYDVAHSVAGDSATAALLFRCDSLGNVYLANLHSEQGKRLRLEMELRGAQERLDSASRALHANDVPLVANPSNQPMYIRIDCKEDSFEVIIRGLRERVTYLEENKQTEQVPVRYVPDYYKNCTRGFWAMLVVLMLALALLIYKNWTNIAAWALKMWAKFKF